MLLNSKHLRSSQLNLSTIKDTQVTCSCIKHTFKQKQKQKSKNIYNNQMHFWTSVMLPSFKVPTPQDPLRNLQAIKSLGTSPA